MFASLVILSLVVELNCLVSDCERIAVIEGLRRNWSSRVFPTLQDFGRLLLRDVNSGLWKQVCRPDVVCVLVTVNDVGNWLVCHLSNRFQIALSQVRKGIHD